MWRLSGLLVIPLLVLALLPTPVFALNNTPETAIVLTVDNAGHTDQLVGDTGGAVRGWCW